jgi:hypothetical protein
MLVLEAIVCEMDHKFFLALDFIFVVFFNRQSQIPSIIKDYIWIAINKHVASDVKFFLSQQQRANVVLNEAIML